MDLNFIDFYILYPGHPGYSSIELIEDDLTKVIVQKYQMIIFTNKGDVFGLPDLGANLLELLHDTSYSAQTVEEDLNNQIRLYIPELQNLEYDIKVSFYQHPERFEEFMVIDFSFNGMLVSTIVQ
jgi:hypothetical protein